MKTRLSKKQEWFKRINLTKDDEVYVGIDVHKKSYSVAIWLNDTPAIDFVMPADNKKLIKLLEKLRIATKMIVYEAGPTGYNLARVLKKVSLPVKVIAPSKTRKAVGQRFENRPTRLQNTGKICRQRTFTTNSYPNHPAGSGSSTHTSQRATRLKTNTHKAPDQKFPAPTRP